MLFSEFDLSLCLDFVTSSAVSFFLQLSSRRSLLFDYLFVARIVCVSICKVLKNLNRSCVSTVFNIDYQMPTESESFTDIISIAVVAQIFTTWLLAAHLFAVNLF